MVIIGSKTSSSQNFLNQILPQTAIISVGIANDYNLPNREIINALSNIGAKVYRTDLDGTIWITSDGYENNVIVLDLNLDGAQKTSVLEFIILKRRNDNICAVLQFQNISISSV